nr:MAG TPA: hypothetical protein [Caudoviricetes sp.]
MSNVFLTRRMFLGFFCIKKPSANVDGFLSTQHIF